MQRNNQILIARVLLAKAASRHMCDDVTAILRRYIVAECRQDEVEIEDCEMLMTDLDFDFFLPLFAAPSHRAVFFNI